MAHIVEFVIEGLAGREAKLALKLNRDLNIFFGVNGSGKTSLLKILHSAMKCDSAGLRRVPFRSACVSIFSVKFNREYVYEVTKPPEIVAAAGTNEDQHVPPELPTDRVGPAMPPWKLQHSEAQPPGAWEHSYLPTSRLWATSERTSGIAYGAPLTVEDEDMLDEQFQAQLVNLWSMFYVNSVWAPISHARARGLGEIARRVLSSASPQPSVKSLDPARAFERVHTFLQKLDVLSDLGTPDDFVSRYKNNQLLQDIVTYIDDVETQVELASAPRDKLQSLLDSMIGGRKRISLKDQRICVSVQDAREIALSALSSGEKHILRILVETLRAGVSSLIVDEPEISMHVDWQTQLVASMQFLNPNAQLILATHSPEIMAGIDNTKIFSL